MKMFLSIVLSFGLSAAYSARAQTTTITIPITNTGPDRVQDVIVQAGELFQILTWSPAYNGPTALKVDGVAATVTQASAATGNDSTVLSPAFAIAGPRTVTFTARNNESLVCTYKISAISQNATANVASQAVVIPENGSANADIILESSTDLTNWTAALPGSYAPSTTKRFFRVRLVTH